MRCFSTSFFPLSDPADVGSLMERLKDIGAEGVELDYRIPAPLFPRLKDALRRSGIMATSLHNFCPIPRIWPTPAAAAISFHWQPSTGRSAMPPSG